MSADARTQTLRVADLIDRPGASRRVDLGLAAHAELDMATLDGDVRLAGVLESVVDGILVRAALAADLDMSCARCLADLREAVVVDVVELFTDPATVDDPADLEPGYEITDGTIDLDTLVRDALIPAVPYRPLCSPACRGLCAQCGANHNEADCSCEDVTVDARWAALEGLQLGDGDQR